MRTMDFSLPGGWHTTVFLPPWGWLAVAIILAGTCGLLLVKLARLVRR